MEFIIGAVLVAIVALCIFVRIKMPVWKGQFSERLVDTKLLQLPDEYVLFSDLLFKSNGHSTQIDHIVVSPYGVFVIETKGYKGWILGGENSEYWTQVIYKSKRQFYNPIKQNEGHVRFLRHLLEYRNNIPLTPIVVFNNSAEIKVNAANHIVVNRRDLKEVILQYHEVIIDKGTIDWITKTIRNNCTIVDKETSRQHKNNVKCQQYRTENFIRNGICPQCGGRLVLRKGSYGYFYGCKNYPKCKFTISK